MKYVINGWFTQEIPIAQRSRNFCCPVCNSAFGIVFFPRGAWGCQDCFSEFTVHYQKEVACEYFSFKLRHPGKRIVYA